MRAKEFITELFSPKGSLPIEWESHMGSVYATAIDHNTGKKIEIHFWQLPEGAVEIDFMVDESYQLTNKGDQFIIFATVVNAIKEYDDRYAPKYLVFSAKESNRKSLYSQMVKRLAPTAGYTIGSIEDLPQEVHDNISLTPGDFVLIHKSAFIDEAELDPRGWGETPMGTDVDYFGLQVKMRPSTFLKLSHPLGSSESNPEVEKHMQAGGKIAYPFLEIKDPIEWEEGDFSQLGKVVNHEGRNRMTQWIKMKGDEPIQVNLFLRGANRRKYITDDMIQALSQGLVSQTGQVIRNPFEANTALEETVTGTRLTSDELYRKLV